MTKGLRIIKFVIVVLVIVAKCGWASESICYGSTSNGRLDDGVKLPYSGENYVSYGRIGSTLGRTYVHSLVKDIVLSSYADLAENYPDKQFKYGETGFKEGGKFKPHHTHRNGLSIDFFTPMVDEKGNSVVLPTHALNKLGYKIELDKKGRLNGWQIDYEALAAHIVYLDKQARKRGFKLWRVIFDPSLQAPLFQTTHSAYLKENILFSTKPAWVRHDEHYHIDFDVPCKAL